jgi:hypothetical protein
MRKLGWWVELGEGERGGAGRWQKVGREREACSWQRARGERPQVHGSTAHGACPWLEDRPPSIVAELWRAA